MLRRSLLFKREFTGVCRMLGGVTRQLKDHFKPSMHSMHACFDISGSSEASPS